ncbi:hypothetical protein [Coleofasciculus sp. E1-EBD-02]|uniref:hypothetical protein n=1 Tax=Coleofasciculus sp. E1-EBD-02 TaxID=3068481 RepID=UPI0032FD1EBF
MSQSKIKNHVTKKARRISGILKGKYGFSLDTVDKALQGDRTALKTLGESARQGQQILELMPLLKDACLTIQKGTEEYNKSIADILEGGATSAINIDKARMKAILANQKYGHQRKELAAEFATAKTAETTRHDYAINYIQLKAYIDQYLQTTDNNAKLLEQTNRPEFKQLDEDNRYNSAVAKHLIQHGDNARIDLIPKRDYVPQDNQNKDTGIWGAINKFRAALGF